MLQPVVVSWLILCSLYLVLTLYMYLLHRTLADVDKDGKLKAEEFILAMHLVDMAKFGQPLPLTLPTELVPPSQRYVNTWLTVTFNIKCVIAIV